MIFLKFFLISQSSKYLMEKNIFEQKEYGKAPFQFYEQEYQGLIKWSLF